MIIAKQGRLANPSVSLKDLNIHSDEIAKSERQTHLWNFDYE